MRKGLILIISASLLILPLPGCSADIGDTSPQGQGYENGGQGQAQQIGTGTDAGNAANSGNAGDIRMGSGNTGTTRTDTAAIPQITGIPGTGGAGMVYERGREDHPGQSYANQIGTRITGNTDTAGNTTGAGAGDTTGDRIGTTGNQLSEAGTNTDSSGLILRSVKTPVRRGGTGGLSIQGKPDTQYTITAVYENGGDMITSTVVRRAGNNGIVDLVWDVDRDTTPGTYGIMITGGGDKLTTTYTVSEE